MIKLFIIFFLLVSEFVVAQENPALLYNEHLNLNASRIFPTRLGMDNTSFQISLF